MQTVRQTRIYEKTQELSKKQRDLVDEEYRAGNAELTRLNEAQRDLVRAETNLASSYIAIQNAKAQLDSAVGANTAEFYMQQDENRSGGFPGLESLNGADEAGQPAEDAAAKADDQPAAAEQKPAAEPKTEAQAEPKAEAKADAPAGQEKSAPAIPAKADAPPQKKN